MKTFSEFIAEAESASTQLSQLRARARILRQKGDMEGALKLEKQAGELQAGTQAKIQRALSDKPTTKTNPNSYVGGYASKPKDVASPVGSTSGVQRTDVPAEPDVRVGSRYVKPGSSGGRGTNTAASGGILGTKGKGR